MLKTIKSEKAENTTNRIFFILFFLYAVLGSNSLTYGKGFISPVMWLTFGLSAVILCYRVLHYKRFFQFPQTVLLFGMLGTIGISTLANIQYDFKGNVIFCLYWVLYFLALFTTEKEKTVDACKQDLALAMKLFLVYTTAAVIASLILYFLGVGEKHVAADTGYAYNWGFVWGRLWGVFINPNNGAVSAAISIVILLYAFITRKKLVYRVLTVISILLHLLFIVLSDSRAGAVALAVALGSFVLFTLFRKYKSGNFVKRIGACVLTLVVAAVSLYTVRWLKTPINAAVSFWQEIESETTPQETPGVTAPPADHKGPSVVDRGYDTSNDISNRRFDVWKSSVEIFLHTPRNMLIGTSFCGFTDYAREHLPQTYIVNNDYADMTTADNEFFNILMSNGIIGIITVAAFVIYILVVVLKRFRHIEKQNMVLFALLLAVILSLACVAMVNSVMFYHFSPNTVLFWFVLGRIVAFSVSKERGLCDDNES